MTIWQSIATNFKNGNIAKWTKGIGQATFTAGMTGAMMHEMLNGNNGCGCQGSIFGNRFGMFGGNYYGNNYGMMFGGNSCCGGNWFNPTNPYVNPMGIGMPNPTMQMNTLNTQYANQLAWNWGYQKGVEGKLMAQASNALQAQQLEQLKKLQQTQQSQQTLASTNAAYAGDVDKNQSTEKGEALHTALNSMSDKEGNAVKGKSFDIIKGGIKSKDKKAGAAEYKSAVSDLGKSYLAYMDKTTGNSDGKITLDEFIDFEMQRLDKNATDEQKTKAKLMAQNAFKKIDQNGDGKADWKELAATIATLDSGTDGKLDAKITSTEFATNSETMYSAQDTTFDNAVRKTYTQLFGKDE